MSYEKMPLGKKLTGSGALRRMPQRPDPARRDQAFVGVLLVLIAIGGALMWWSM